MPGRDFRQQSLNEPKQRHEVAQGASNRGRYLPGWGLQEQRFRKELERNINAGLAALNIPGAG
jgi:hypothetical protein